uniref:CS domain-containing protein n=2 Tax=Clytia hemisphaerica TaxID=252671 RepID=A0A7M5XA26_9CNID
MACTNMDEFRKIHNHQLKSIGFPNELVQNLYNQLANDDTSSPKIIDTFQVKKSGNTRPLLLAKKSIKKESCFFLLEHIWTNDGGSKAAEQLHKSPILSTKLSQMFNLPDMGSIDEYYNYDTQKNTVIDVTGCAEDAAKKACDEYKGQTVESIIKCLDKDTPDLQNKIGTDIENITFEEFVSGLKTTGSMPENASEGFLRKMYDNFSRDKEGSASTLNYNWEDENDIVSVYIPIPLTAKKNNIKSALTTNTWKLFVDGKEMLNGELFARVKADDSYWAIEQPGVLCMTLEKVLTDETWKALLKGEEKLSAEAIIQTAWAKHQVEDIYYNGILDTMWKYNQTYSLSSPDSKARHPQWYIMEEIGSSLTHNNNPNFKCSPFFYSALGRAYSIIWPIKDIKEGQMCTRNFIPQIIANETMDICKVRLKTHTDIKLTDGNNNKFDTEKEEQPSEIEPVNVEKLSTKKISKSDEERLVWLGDYNGFVSDEVAKSLPNVTFATESDPKCVVKFISLNKTSVSIEGEILPCGEMLANKDYLQNYIKLRYGNQPWFVSSFILPNALVEFNEKYEETDLLQYWIVRPVDNRQLALENFVTSQFARIVRVCEAGSIAVSQYITDQIPFRDRLVTLSYPVMLCTDIKCAYISKEPALRFSKDESYPTSFIDEYKNHSSVTQEFEGAQAADLFSDYKVAMNKLLLPQDPDKGWSYVEEQIYQAIGQVSKALAKDMRLPATGDCKNYVMCNFDVIVDSSLQPKIIDIVGHGELPRKLIIGDFVTLALGGSKDSFVKVN